jgi:hypothetical protein
VLVTEDRAVAVDATARRRIRVAAPVVTVS